MTTAQRMAIRPRQHVIAQAAPRAAYRRAEIAVLGAILVLAATLRLAHLGALPLFYDESTYIRAIQVFVTAPSLTTWLYGLHQAALPLFPTLAAPLTAALPDPVLAARLTSALIGVATVCGVWATGRTWAGWRLGLLAALLYALCPFAVFYNRMGMLDGPVSLCGAWALFFALRLSRSAGTRDVLGLGLCLGAGLLTKLTAVSMFLLPVAAVLFATPLSQRVVFRRAILAIILGVAPLLWLLSLPESRPLVAIMSVHVAPTGSPLALIVDQMCEWAGALWLYLTPPVIVAALVGLGMAGRERAGRLVASWAVLGGLLPALTPEQFLAPRYFLYISVPIVLLAAHSILACFDAIIAFGHHLDQDTDHYLSTGASAAVVLAVLTLVPSVLADRAMLTDGRQTPLTPFDRWQYVGGWPSGYTLRTIVSAIRAAERTSPITVIYALDSPPGDSLAVPLGQDRRIHLQPLLYAEARYVRPPHAPSQRALLILFHPAGQRAAVPAPGWDLLLRAPAHVPGGTYMIYTASDNAIRAPR